MKNALWLLAGFAIVGLIFYWKIALSLIFMAALIAVPLGRLSPVKLILGVILVLAVCGQLQAGLMLAGGVLVIAVIAAIATAPIWILYYLHKATSK
jgi:hypothetical protein